MNAFRLIHASCLTANLTFAAVLLELLVPARGWAQSPGATPAPAAPASTAPAPAADPPAQPSGAQPAIPPRTLPDPAAPPRPPGVSSAPTITGLTGEVESKLRQRFEEFFRNVKRGESAFAYARLLEGSRLAQQREVLAQITANTDQTLKHVGRLGESELVSVTSASRTLKELVFIGNCEHQPIRWRFVCYSNGGRWHVLKIELTDEVDRMFLLAPIGPELELPVEPNR